ncbi:MAG: SCO family protein [Calditrichia bacterium]
MKKLNINFFTLFIPVSILIILFSTLSAQGNNSEAEVGIDEKLGGIIPGDIYFNAENGDTLSLGEYIDKPTVISLVYYNCPGICTPLLGAMVDVLEQMDLIPGKDYKVLTISFDTRDTPQLALKKKTNYFNRFEKPFPEKDWRWVTGDSLSIKRITDAVGFNFMPDKNDFAHPTTLIVVSPQRKITRYLYGITYLPFDLKMAIVEASEGRVSPTISKLLRFCFSYDREGQKYAFNFTRVGGGLILLFVIIFVVVTSVKSRKTNEKRGN